MVKSGFSRAYGTNLRRAIAIGTQNRVFAMLCGAAVTLLLQSSTAVILLTTSFVKKGFMTVAAALAIIIGADISTTLVAQLLTFDLSWLSPVMLSSGIIIYLYFEREGRIRHIARAMIGIGLMLLSLSLIRETSQPLRDSDILPLVLQPLDDEPMLAILVATLLTWLMHSSLAAVLIFAAMAGNHVISLNLGLAFVLGANLGGALIPFVATSGDGAKIRQITTGNIVMKVITILIALPLLPEIMPRLAELHADAGRQIVLFHTAFNISLGLLFLPFVKIGANILDRALPERKNAGAEFAPAYLDVTALDTPVIALAGAARETLRMAEIVEKMLEKTIVAFEKNDENLVAAIRHLDHRVDLLNREIKLFLTRLSQESLDPKEADRYIQILTFSTNLESCGDIIDKNLMDLAIKKIRKQENFSEVGFREIKDFHKKVLQNLKLAQTIFLSEDPELAIQLVESKKTVRQAEVETSRLHFARLREGLTQSLATSELHLDLIRDLRRINSYITSVAYTIIDHHEEFRERRKSEPAALPPENPA